MLPQQVAKAHFQKTSPRPQWAPALIVRLNVRVDMASTPRLPDNNAMGIVIFSTVVEAVHAGFMIESPIPDSEGFIHARIRTSNGWACALIRAKVSNNDR